MAQHTFILVCERPIVVDQVRVPIFYMLQLIAILDVRLWDLDFLTQTFPGLQINIRKTRTATTNTMKLKYLRNYLLFYLMKLHLLARYQGIC